MSQKLSEALNEAILEAFDKVDVESTGQLGRDEVRKVLQHIGQNPTAKEMKTDIPDGRERVQRDEICDFVELNVLLKARDTIDNEIAEAFARFDTNEKSLISVEDFKEILTQLGDEPLTDKEAEMIIESLDVKDHLSVTDLSKLLVG